MDKNFIKMSLSKALDGSAGAFQLDVNLTIDKACFLALRGPSGAGKTTLLRIIAGLTNADKGSIHIGGHCWFDSQTGYVCKVQKRNVGLVFQDFALFPNMTVAGQLRYAMAGKANPKAIMDYLDMVGLAQLAKAYPSQLSGGQKQRLALIRTLARKPNILLLDEPLASLDPAMREHLQDEILRLHRFFGMTTIMVSHDASETLRLSDRVIELDKGKIVKDFLVGSPQMLEQENAGNGLQGYFLSNDPLTGGVIVEINGNICRVKTPHILENMTKGQKISFSEDCLTLQS